MKNKLLYFLPIIGLLIACQDFLDVKPVGKLIPSEVSEFEKILNNSNTVRWWFMDNNRGTSLAFLGDNLEISSNMADYNYLETHPNIDRYAAYIFNPPYNNPQKPDYFWEYGYRAIGLFNNVIEGVEGVKNEQTERLANELIAQARAGRAWAYLNMSMVYGPIYDPEVANDTRVMPYRTSASPLVPNPDLATTAEIFSLVKEDLEFALKNVPDQVGNPSRADKCTVQMLMAYYYMFIRDFDKMLEYADMAWETALLHKGNVDNMIYNYNKFYYLEDPSVSPSPGTDAEYYLELRSLEDDNLNQSYHRENLFYRTAATGGDECYPSVDFLNNFDQEHDMRYRLFALKARGYSSSVAGEIHDDGIRVLYLRKMEMSQGFTYPELLLMRAEAYARTHNTKAALKELNLLRKYRYSNSNGTDLPGGDSFSEDQLLEEILRERRRELPIATFQRLLDLKRLSLDVGKPWCKTMVEHVIGSRIYSAPIRSEFFILPIPNNIIDYNPQWGLQLDPRPYIPKG